MTQAFVLLDNVDDFQAVFGLELNITQSLREEKKSKTLVFGSVASHQSLYCVKPLPHRDAF